MQLCWNILKIENSQYQNRETINVEVEFLS